MSEASFIYQNCLTNYKTMFHSTELSPKHSYCPPPLGENFNALEHYLQRGACLCTLEILSCNGTLAKDHDSNSSMESVTIFQREFRNHSGRERNQSQNSHSW